MCCEKCALIQKPPSAPELAEHIFLEWDVDTVSDEIILRPYAEESYEERARADICAADPMMGRRVISSELHPRRYGPGF